MERFFYTEEQHQIDAITDEIDLVNNAIDRLAKKQGRKYTPPDIFKTDWLLFACSKGDAMQEDYIRENYTRLQVMKRVLMRSIEALHSYQSTEK